MEHHWTHVKWNFKNLFNFTDTNPYHGKKRKAYVDILHSVVNIPVEFCRRCPALYGHLMFYMTLVKIAMVMTIIFLI